MKFYTGHIGAPFGFLAESDDQARLILQHITEGIMDAPLPHGAVWTAQDESSLVRHDGQPSEDAPVFVDRAARYAPVDPAAAGECPICAGHARRQNYPTAAGRPKTHQENPE